MGRLLEVDLASRTARTINQWTVAGLTGGSTYWFGVTCTSRSGVESWCSPICVRIKSIYGMTTPTNAKRITSMLWQI